MEKDKGLGLKHWLSGPTRKKAPEKGDRPGRVDSDRRRLAVLPFANLSPDPNDSYFADGITEEIISIASTVSGLSVISRTSVMGYKGTTKKVREIGEELDVGSVLEGSFRKAGNKIRITTQLINVTDDSHLWTMSYDRELNDIFAVQTDIAKQVADALKVKILPTERQRIERAPTESTEAFSLYLRGRYHWNERTEKDLSKALQYFEKAVGVDPAFARAYSGMADTYSIMAFQNLIPPQLGASKARTLAEQALGLDGDLSEAHTSLAYVYDDEFNWTAAEAEYRKSLETNPSYATGHFWYSIHLTWLGRHDEAVSHAARAIELDPLSPGTSIALGQALTYARRYNEAIDHLRLMLSRSPETSNLRFILGLAYLYNGNYPEAEREERKAVEGSSHPDREEAVLGSVLARTGRTAEAREILADLEKRNVQLLPKAVLLTAIGDKEKAISCLQEAYSSREAGLGWIGIVPSFDALKTDPRFIEILMKMGLPVK